MLGLFQQEAVAIYDLSNFVARAAAIAGEKHIGLFCDMLRKQRVRMPLHRFVFAVEGKGTERRREICAYYKANRTSTTEFNIARQNAIKVLRYVECEVVRAPNGEADDAIASYIHRKCPEAAVVVVSNDRDLWQLINQNVKVRCKIKRTVLSVDKHVCLRELGVAPLKVPLLKSLIGDPSDGIPRSVPSIKEALLVRLANEADNASDIPATVEKADWLKDKEKEKILENMNTILRHERITTLDTSSDLDILLHKANRSRFMKTVEHFDVKGMSKDDMDIIIGVKL